MAEQRRRAKEARKSGGGEAAELFVEIGEQFGSTVFVGDAVWDVEACERAGVPCIGVLTGGAGRDELRDAGATGVFEDPSELLDDIRETRLMALATE